MKKPRYFSTVILLALCLTACAFHVDDAGEKESGTESPKISETNEKEKAKPSAETDAPQETPVPQKKTETTVSVLEHLASPEQVDEGYDWEYHYTDTTLGALPAMDTIISGIYMDGTAPYIIADNASRGPKIRRYGNVAGSYEALKKVDSKELPEKCSGKERDKINIHSAAGSDGYNDVCCERNGIDERGGHYVFTQNRNSEMNMADKPVDFLDFPALWLFNEKGKITKQISWARLTGIEKLQREVVKASKRAAYYHCAYVIDDTMQDGILYFTFTVIDSAGKNKKNHAYYYAVLDVESETMLSCEEIDFEWPKIYGKYLVGITPDYKKIVVQDIKSGKKKKVKNTAGKHILTYAMGGTTVYWMDMDNLYWKDVSSGKTGTQPMNLREAIGDNTLMHNNTDEGWEEVEESIRTESCARNDLTVSENGNLYGVFWSNAKGVDEIEVCFCNYMVLKFKIAKEPSPAE